MWDHIPDQANEKTPPAARPLVIGMEMATLGKGMAATLGKEDGGEKMGGGAPAAGRPRTGRPRTGRARAGGAHPGGREGGTAEAPEQQQQECLTLAKGNKQVTFQARDPRLESWQKQQQEQQQKAKEDLADEGKANP